MVYNPKQTSSYFGMALKTGYKRQIDVKYKLKTGLEILSTTMNTQTYYSLYIFFKKQDLEYLQDYAG